MIYSIDFQNAYVDLYRLMRNYIWDLDVVEMLADVEVATYDAFIDLEKLSKSYQKLYPCIIEVARDNKDEELQKSAEAFKKMIEDGLKEDSPAVLDLYKVQEAAIDVDGKEILPE